MRDRNMPEDHCTPPGKGSGLRLQWWEMSTCSLSPFKPLLIQNNFAEKAQPRARDQGSACVWDQGLGYAQGWGSVYDRAGTGMCT